MTTTLAGPKPSSRPKLVPVGHSARQQRIIDAAIAILVRDGLSGWTIERVARQAGCAKGLVHYHFDTKWQLLALVASALRRQRLARRAAAFNRSGADALDALWDTLYDEMASGECAAWFALATVQDRTVREALPATSDELQRVASAMSTALSLPEMPVGRLRVILSTLNGMQLPLLLGDKPEAVREVYDRFWLATL
ncbi:MAG TPA: TetR/AcrR family transcriptional regulator [Gemmatimonadales bacterium]|nr:TetR/AcrR family transcriptional regulator [Gemmatimonadales bacterium]